MLRKLTTPVLLIGFNRPELTQRVLTQIAKVRPGKLYIAVDGPRNRADVNKINGVKQIIKQVNWPCIIKTNFQTKNLGCKLGPVAAMDWFFKHESQGIILEDDVLADESFFYFADELLKKYEKDERIGSISGNNFQFGWKNSEDSYYFSRYSHSCGWATWRRTWNKYDVNITAWPSQKRSGELLKRVFTKPQDRYYWTLIFDGIYSKELDSAWDYQWNFMMWSNNMLGIIPNQNLVSNIGFGIPNATHTKQKSIFSQMQVIPICFPLRHPIIKELNLEADRRTQHTNYILWKEMAMILIRRYRMVYGKVGRLFN